MESILLLLPDTENPGGSTVKGEKGVKGLMAGVGVGGRKQLADISNLMQNQDNKKLSVTDDSKEYISKLQQENLALVKLLAERNKIIEISGVELQKLRIGIQKLQQQNKQLAQANSQMLGELNSAKDRLKILQHELGCSKSSLVAIKLMSQEKAVEVNFTNKENGVETTVCDKLVRSTKEKMENNKPIGKCSSKVLALDSKAINQVQAQKNVNKKRSSSRRQSARFRSADQELTEDLLETNNSLELSTVDAEQYQEKVESKSLSLRRQSSRFKSQQPVEEPVEEFCTNDGKVLVPSGDDTLRESCSPSILLLKTETEAPNIELEFEGEESRRSSIRPKRRAVEKIQSYKEISLNVKMRRSE